MPRDAAPSRDSAPSRDHPRRSTTSLFHDLRKAANHPCLLRRIYTEADVALIAKAALDASYFGAGASLRMIEAEVRI